MSRSFTHLTIIGFALVSAASCRNEEFEQKWDAASARSEDDQGGGARRRDPPPPRAIHLPAPAGKELLCTQGVGGEFSHTYVPTAHDLDFDTDNARDEEVYAPISGTAYAHIEGSSANFGIHVNIALGDGSYIVLGHLKRVFVESGEDVAEGQMIGYEGCTGLCTGDHIHIGRHTGNPEFPAEFGDSIEGRYFVQDSVSASGQTELSGEAFVCDVRDGQSYRSMLQIVRWHPDGSLVKLPDRADVYRIDQNTLRRIATQDVFLSYRYDFANVTLISSQEFGCYNVGYDIGAPGMVEAAYDRDGVLWLFVAPRERADRYRVRVRQQAWEAVLASWGLPYTGENPPRTRSEEDDLFLFWPERDGYAVFRDGTLVRENSSADVYVISNGSALPIADQKTYTALGFSKRRIHVVPTNTVLPIQARIGSCRYGNGCVDMGRVTSCGDRGDLANMGGVSSEVSEDTTGESSANTSDDRGLSTIYQQSADESRNEAERYLTVTWTTPFSAVADRITLSGEYRFADQSYGFFWHELMENHADDSVTYVLAGVGSGDLFRFSVEFETTDGNVSWSCIGPHPNGHTQGRIHADVDGEPVATSMVGDPTGQTTGCGLILTIP